MGYFKKVLVGTGWMGFLRGLTRGFGFLKIAILARILTPQDFGIFGIASLSLALLETITEPGVSLALIQQEDEVDDYISTAWIISILRGILISVLIFSFSGLIASFFKSEMAASILKLSALIPLVRGFINPAAVNFVKKLEFKNEFFLRLIPVILDITLAIYLSLKLRSPEAIIYGMLAGALLEVALTFLMLKIRPKFIFITAQAKKLMNFGKWVTWGWIMSYLSEQFDDILVGRFLGSASLGVYQMAFKLSVLPSTELSEVVSKVAFPVYSKISGDKKRAKIALFKTTFILVAFAFPIFLLTFTFPKQIIQIALGNQWLQASNTLRILSIFGLIRASGQAASAMVYALGKPEVAALYRTLVFLMMAVLLYPMILQYGINGAAMTVVITSLIIQFPFWKRVLRLLQN